RFDLHRLVPDAGPVGAGDGDDGDARHHGEVDDHRRERHQDHRRHRHLQGTHEAPGLPEHHPMPRLTPTPPRRLRRGFSLPELIITIFLLSIVGTAVVRTFTKQQQVYKDTAKTATMRRELRMTGMLMTQD